MLWARFLLRRLLRGIIVMAVLVVVTFAMVRLVPGDPAARIHGIGADPAAVAATRERLGLDQPWPAQFLSYVSGVLRFDFGKSFQTGEPVSTIIGYRLGPTLEAALLAACLIAVGGLILGLWIGVLTERRRPAVEISFSGVTGVISVLPPYLLGTLLVWLFAVQLGWLPVAGSGSLAKTILPAAALGLAPMCMLARVVRVETLTVLGQDYMRMARGKHLPGIRVFVNHLLPNILGPVLPIMGALAATLVGGSVVIERVFARPGLGDKLATSVQVGDFPVVQGLVIFLGGIVVLTSLVADVLAAVIDPRVRRAVVS
jgi:peptide/nickel transport system permease protein